MEPKKATARKTIRIDQEVLDDLEVIAKVDERNFNNLAGIILRKYRDRMKIDPKYSDAIKKSRIENKK